MSAEIIIKKDRVITTTGKLTENGLNNITAKTEQSRAQKKWENGVWYYSQSNCQCTLTDEGYRIYRGANLNPSSNGSTMWGGFVLNNTNNRFGLTKGHSYVFILDVKGKTSNAVRYPDGNEGGWSNNVGWGGGGLMPTPTEILVNWPTANYNSSEFKTFYYAFTINDDIYKVCTHSYSSFNQGQTYISYSGLKFGFGYTDTGSMGTDLYIKNIRLYDITNISNKDMIKFLNNGNIECTEINEITNSCGIDKYGTIYCKEFIEK